MVIACAMVIRLTHNEIALYSMKEGLIMKKTLKRLSALLATAVMTVSCGVMNAFASESNASFTLTSTSSEAGSLAVVDLVLESQNQCNGYQLNIKYDDRLELVENVKGAFAIEYMKDVNSVYIVNLSGSPFADGAVSTLTFRLPEDAAAGETFDVTITDIDDARYNDGIARTAVINNSTITVKKVSDILVYETVVNGTVVTESAPRGDVNGDGKVELSDLIAAAKSMVTKKSTERADFFADVNQDGKVDLQDLVIMAKYNLAKDKTNAWEKIMGK